MKRIVLISCAKKKQDKKSKAKDLYVSDLFKKSLAYAQKLSPDKIFILSALHHLLDLNKEIEPYNVTLSYVSPQKREPGLKILTSKEKIEWGKKVVEQLKKEADIEKDTFIFLAAQAYIKPIVKSIKNYKDILNGLNQGKRKQFLGLLLTEWVKIS
jgi:hypothetical protein